MGFYFWKNWSTAHRIAVWAGLGLLLAGLVGLLTTWTLGLANVVRWDVLSELTTVPVSVSVFSDGLLDYPIPGSAYLITEQFVASGMSLNLLALRLLALGVCLGLALVMAALPRLGRWPFLLSMGLLILILASFRLEALQLPGLLGTALSGRLPFLLLVVLFGGLAYYFHAFRPDAPLAIRLLLFLLLSLGSWLFFHQVAGVPFPAPTFLSYALPGLFLLTIVFVFVISSEIIAGLVYLTSMPRSGGRPLGLNNLLIIAGLYLVNLLLVWLSNTKRIDWSPILISPFLLYLVSVVLGFWGLRQPLRQSEGGLSYRESGAFLYLGLALIATLTLTYAFVVANDPLIEALEDIILYSHLASGVAFLFYVLVNFYPLYRQQLAVHKVLYKPMRFSLTQTRVVAAIGTATLLAMQNFFTLNQAIAGYFNNLGDVHAATGELRVAEQYYRLAISSEFQNHKSNYALASLALQQGDKATAAVHFQRALLKQPSPQAYAALSTVLLEDNLFFEAVKTLQGGIRTFPRSGELQNNLGYLYAKTSVADSAYYYLAAATGNTSQDEVPQTNLLAFWVKNPRLLGLDSLAKATEARTYEPHEANRAAVDLLRQASEKPETYRPGWLADTASTDGLSVGKFARLYNYALLNRKPDSTLLRTLPRLEQNPANQDFVDDLLFARAVANYYTGDQRTAFELTSQLAEGNSRTGAYYQSVTGLWLMEQGLYRKAAEILGENTDTLSAYYRAVAFTKVGALVEAQSLWDMASRNDPNVQKLADALYDRRPPGTDTERAFRLVYGTPQSAESTRAMLAAIRNPDLRTVAAAQLSRRALLAGQTAEGEAWYQQLPEFANLSPLAGSLIAVTYMRLQNAKGKFTQTLEAGRQDVAPPLQAEKDLLLAQAAEARNQTGPAGQHYRQALRRAPFNAEVVSASARFDRRARRTETAYNRVVNALPLNPYNAGLLKTYVDLCLDLSLFDYAEEALLRLQASTPPADYQAYLASYQARRALIEKQKEAFQ